MLTPTPGRSNARARSRVDWLDRIGPELREVLDEALVRAEVPSQAGFAAAKDGGTTRASARRSRQAEHAHLSRVRSTAVIATAYLCGHDDRFIDAMLHPDFAWLRPLCADTHTKSAYFTHLLNADDLSGYERLFDRAFALLTELSPRLRTATTQTALHAYAPLAGMYFATVIFGERLGERWQAALARAEHEGMLDNPHLRLQLCALGSFVGRPERHIEVLLDDQTVRSELTDMFCFVRRDIGEPLFELQAAIMRGQAIDPLDCLFPTRPGSTVRHLADYALSCMRAPEHFNNAGLVLMVLTWVDAVRSHASQAIRSRAASEDTRAWKDVLRKIERVQVMEKGRFFDVVDPLPEGPTKQRLLALWRRG